jgi:Flp pilus assembly protein TadD
MGSVDSERKTSMADVIGGACPPNLLSELVEAAKADDARGLARVDALLGDYPQDPRLHFMRGSLLAGQGRYDEARDAMVRAVDISPGYAVARFQLGFLELTCGRGVAADATWRPLESLPANDPLRVLARGLSHLIRDEFGEAIALLHQGMALNTSNPALNADMQLIIDKINADGLAPPTNAPISEAHLLLQQYSTKATKH